MTFSYAYYARVYHFFLKLYIHTRVDRLLPYPSDMLLLLVGADKLTRYANIHTDIPMYVSSCLRFV